ncbi:MAG: universal stress protein [Woeseia sp.]|nr:universal stress protein [Woeseia sp.]
MADKEPLALRRGLDLLAAGVSKLHLLHVVCGETDEQTTLLEETEKRVKALIEKECPDTPGVTSEVTWNNSLSEAVTAACAVQDYDLIVKTGHRTESLTHVPTDFFLLRVPRAPVMVLSTRAWSAKSVVLAAIDFAPGNPAHMALNRKILKVAREVADLTGSRLHCCYVVTHSRVLADMDVIEPREMLARFNEKHGSELIDFVAEYGIEPDDVHVRSGAPAKQIPSIANKAKADLVVVGTHQRSGMTGFLIGNTCEKVLHVLRTAILTVKPE